MLKNAGLLHFDKHSNIVSKSIQQVFIWILGMVSFFISEEKILITDNSIPHIIWGSQLIAGATLVLVSHILKNENLKRIGIVLEFFSIISVATISLVFGFYLNALFSILAYVFAWTLAEKVWILTVGDCFERWVVLGWDPRDSNTFRHHAKQ